MNGEWLLFGTLGCHLCEDAEQLLKQLHDAAHIRWQTIDIINLSNAEMEALATCIPVLKINAKTTLNWPFSLVDLIRYI